VPDAHGAQAFGPTGAAREVVLYGPVPEGAFGYVPPTGHGPTAEADGLGTIDHSGEWPVFRPEPGTVYG
jgi:hypothetical protein